MSDSILVVDIGTSSVRAAVVRPDTTVTAVHQRPVLPSTPAPGLVELDPSALADAALDMATAALDEAGPVGAVGIANQRASAIAWDRTTGAPVGPGIGWQDLRTVGTCLALKEEGIPLAPNESATKFMALLDAIDPEKTGDICLGTVDSWIAWHLSGGTAHVTDASNAALTGLLLRQDASGWDQALLDRLRIPDAALPRLVDTAGAFAEASRLPGSPPLAALAGDQQASLVGQGCVQSGMAKITFGTGAMLDICLGTERPDFSREGPAGCFPIVAWKTNGETTWGVEAIALAAGTNVEWLRDDLGIIDSAEQSNEVAAACPDSGELVFVPALLGFGTPRWDHGARGTLLGVTRGTGRPEIVRAVLEGVAHTGADLVEAAEQDAGTPIPRLRVDGGMTANPTFVQAVADATQRPVEISPEREATTRGAALLAGLAIGTWPTWDDIAETWEPARIVEPTRNLNRDRWRVACDRAAGWIPELSAIKF